MILAAALPLMIVLGLVLGAALGALLVHLVRTAPPPIRAEHENEVAKQAARAAVDEVIARVR